MTENLPKLLAESERRYAQLRAYVADTTNPAILKLLERHDRDTGLTDWRERFAAANTPQPDTTNGQTNHY